MEIVDLAAVRASDVAVVTGLRRRPPGLKAVAAVVLLALAVGGCGAKEDDAKEQSEAVVQRLNDGACDDPPDGLTATQWQPMCRAVRAALPDDADVTLLSTTAQTSGEIGYSYTSVASFTGTDGSTRTIRLMYRGTGTSAAVPELSYVTMDDEVLFDGG